MRQITEEIALQLIPVPVPNRLVTLSCSLLPVVGFALYCNAATLQAYALVDHR